MNLFENPKFENLCQHCKFLGTYDGVDLYVHTEYNYDEEENHAVIVYGETEDDCQSSNVLEEEDSDSSFFVHFKVAKLIIKNME